MIQHQLILHHWGGGVLTPELEYLSVLYRLLLTLEYVGRMWHLICRDLNNTQTLTTQERILHIYEPNSNAVEQYY